MICRLFFVLISILFVDTTSQLSDSRGYDGSTSDYNGCDMFMGNGALYMELQALTGVFLRGMDWLSSDNFALQAKGLDLWETQLYPNMADDFQMRNPEMGVLIESKKDLMDNALAVGQDRADGAMATESFTYFECNEDKSKVRMKMYFNTHERNGNNLVWLHCSMIFEYDDTNEMFLVYQFEFDDPLSDEM